jgi:hypothetical protein
MFRLLKPYIFLLIGISLALASFKPEVKLFQTNNGKIHFSSEAPLELIKAESKDLLGVLDANKKNFSFKVRIRSFEGFNSRTQREHFNENYMQSETYPEASFKGKLIEDVDFSKDGSYTIRAKGMLVIHGVEQERILKVDLAVKDERINLKSNFSVLLSDHNIPIPKVVYQKLANEIKVEVAASLQPR